jgi:hypothetical protein
MSATLLELELRRLLLLWLETEEAGDLPKGIMLIFLDFEAGSLLNSESTRSGSRSWGWAPRS